MTDGTTASKRATVRISPTLIYSWDHSKLGWRYQEDRTVADLTRPSLSRIQTEQELQDQIVKKPNELEPGLWIVGYEFALGGNRADLLAVDGDGRLVVVEVKRANATREAVGQVLDYVSALNLMDPRRIVRLIDSAPVRAAFSPPVDFEAEYVDRHPGGALSDLMPPRALLASTAESQATERILAYLEDHGVEVHSVVFDVEHVDDDSRAYRRRRSPSADTADPRSESEPQIGRLAASKPRQNTGGRRKINEVHDGVKDYARAEYAGAKLFPEVHGTIASALYEGTEERRALTGESFGITVKMRATESDPQKTEADYVTVRFYPHEPDHVRLSIFEAAWQRGGDEVVQLFNLWELDPVAGESQSGQPLRFVWFDRETWDAHAELFKRFLRNAKTAWEAEREAGRG